MECLTGNIWKRASFSTTPVALFALAAAALTWPASSFGQMGDRKDADGMVQEEIWRQIDVPPAPVLSPEEALKSIQTPPGFRLELVATEPLVNDPVAIAWDEDGRLYAVEMRGYMPDVDGNGEDLPVGRIVVLEDIDDDGRMDRSTVFLDGLVMPRAIAITRGGVLVAEPPRLWFCQDLDGDLKSDRKRDMGPYAANGSVEHSENGLMRGLDNWFYNAKSNRRHKWQGDSLIVEETASRGQWGMTMDDYGRLFYNTNSNPARAEFVPHEYANRNPGYASKTGINIDIASDRRVFSNRVNPGVNRGYRGPTLRDDFRLNTTTAASGPAIYRGNQYPFEYYGNLFTPEPSGNAILRYRIEEKGLELVASKRVVDDPVWEKVDFLVSTDERFRPVNLATGPDGFLYIVDMYRGIIQHKIFVTTFLRKQILERGLDSPVGLGRIYRLVHDDSSTDRSLPSLSTMSDTALVGLLGSDNGWARDTAQRLIVEKEELDLRAIGDLKRQVSADSELSALHALRALEGRDQLDTKTAIAAFAHPSPWVRVHAIRAAEKSLSNSSIDSPLVKSFVATLGDPSFRVRLQAVQSLSVFEDDAFVVSHIKRIFHPDLPNAYMEDAIVSSLSGRELHFIDESLADVRWIFDEGRASVLAKLATAMFHKKEADSLLALATNLGPMETDNWKQEAIIAGLADTASRPESKSIKLKAKPKSFYQFVNAIPESEKPLRDGLDRVFTWPGRATDDPFENLSAGQIAQIQKGEEIYQATCMACHQADGNGLAGLAPALNGSEWVTGSPERLALMVFHGVTGPIQVNGESWNSVMPGHGVMPQFQGKGLAQTLSYIRTAWGNKSKYVSEEMVRPTIEQHKGRVLPWSVKELEGLGF